MLALAVLLSGCQSVQAKPCEFAVLVRVTPDHNEECRALGGPQYRNDKGQFIKDSDTVMGCAPEGRIITNGTEANMGHEMKHQVERNCK